jgi:hypothetical protein
MATQVTKILDVDKSFLPIDPNAFLETMHATGREDYPNKVQEVSFYEGYNFLPTPYGYKSYFGLRSVQALGNLPSRPDQVFIFQSSEYVNTMIALCETGIYTTQDDVNSWTAVFTWAAPPVGEKREWTKCVIGNNLYCYRAGDPYYYTLSNEEQFPTPGEIEGALPTVVDPNVPHPPFEFYRVTPNFLNMEGQAGIFKAGSRLGFWDSLNSIGWSSVDDFADFKPSVTSLAGNTLFNEVTGRIVTILSSEDGFVVYATKSIIYIARNESVTNQWDPVVLLKNAGIAFPRQACSGASDSDQYAYTTIGLYSITKAQGKIVVPEVIDFLKESNDPVYVSIIEGRYLFLELLSYEIAYGQVSWTTELVDGGEYTFPALNIENPSLYTAAEYSAGDVPAMQAHAELMRQLTGFPIANSTFTPAYAYELSDKHIIDIASVFPSATIVQLNEMTLFNSSNLDTGSLPPSAPAWPADLPVFIGRATLGWDTQLDFTDLANPVASPATLFANNFSVVEGIDDSRTLTPLEASVLSLDSFLALQQSTWADNDLEVNGALITMSGYSIAAQVGWGQLSGATAPTTTSIILKQASPSPSLSSNSVGFIVGANANRTDDFLINTAGRTIDSGWTPPAVTLDSQGNAIIRRKRGFHTQVTPRVLIESTFLGTTPDIGIPGNLIYSYETIATGTQLVVPFPIADVDDPENPWQEGIATLIGYNYTDSSGTAREIRYDTPIVPPYRWNPVSPLPLPPASFSLQDGSIGPIYPTIAGALVYDTQLKKWGKMLNDYKVLVDYSPINIQSGSVISFNTFGVLGGLVTPSGATAIFDKNPVDSYIKLGKIGFSRQGMTKVEEVRVHFRTPSSGSLQVETSLDGRLIELGLFKWVNFTNSVEQVLYTAVTGRWHNIVLAGTYDIQYVEMRASVVGKR